ncbi:hypothetical protein, partial [Clostridioides difficile]|uniref:hypothetical protein n=1 Tax=Clostridioides difficile TaxID=1496 RepID=UPI0021158B8E
SSSTAAVSSTPFSFFYIFLRFTYDDRIGNRHGFIWTSRSDFWELLAFNTFLTVRTPTTTHSHGLYTAAGTATSLHDFQIDGSTSIHLGLLDSTHLDRVLVADFIISCAAKFQLATIP